MHVIFLVHGMGTFADGWSKSIQDTISTTYFDPGKYKFVGAGKFADQFRFVEINYNKHFDEYLAAAKKQADNLAKWSKLASNLDAGVFRILQRVVQGAARAPSNSFLVSHLADVGLFMATDVGELIKADVAAQIAAELAKLDLAKDRWSIIAHSLGTRVTMEVLQAGFTSVPSLRSFGKARMVMMVANVSRLLEKLSPFNAGDVYHDAVFPSLRAPNGVCTHFVNCTHRLDPIAFAVEFDAPATFGDGDTLVNRLYHGLKLPLSDITSKEVHSLEHYLEHPLVHTAMLQFLVPGSGARGPTDAEMNATMTAYRKRARDALITNVWRSSLEQLKGKPTGNIEHVIDLWEEYGHLIA
jgi:hypothetical protein